MVSFPSDNTPIFVGEVHSMSRLTIQLIVTVQKGCRVEKAQGVDCAQSPVPHREIHHPSHQEEDYYPTGFQEVVLHPLIYKEGIQDPGPSAFC